MLYLAVYSGWSYLPFSVRRHLKRSTIFGSINEQS